MATPDQALSGPQFTVSLSPDEAAHLRHLAAACGVTPEQAIAGMIANQLTQCAATVVALRPSAARVTH